MSVWDQNLSRDQLNRSWDAAISGASQVESRANPDDLALLRRFHALDATPGPDAVFVERLRQQMAFGAGPQTSLPQPVPLAPPRSEPKPSPSRRARSPHYRRWVALAAMLLLVMGGALVLWIAQRTGDLEERSIPAAIFETAPATPAVASGEAPLLHATIDPASIGATGQEAWTVALEYTLEIPTGQTYEQNGPESGDTGISVVVVLNGTFDASSSGPTLLFQKGDAAGQDLAAGTAISLVPGDAWITSMKDLVTASNSSGAMAEILRYAMGAPGDGTYFTFSPNGGYPYAHDPEGPGWPAGPVTIDVQKVPLEKDGTHQIEVHNDESFLLVTSGTGAVRVTKDGSNRGASTTATSLGDYPPGSYTISRDLSVAVDLYLARWSSAASTESTAGSTASSTAPESLLMVTLDPDSIDAGSQANWNYTGIFRKSSFHPGQQISLDAETWGAGLTTTTVLDGTLSLSSEGTVAVLEARAHSYKTLAPGTPITLAPGDSAFYDGNHGIVIRNDSNADAEFITFVAFEELGTFFPDVPYPENLWGPTVPLVDVDLDQRFEGKVVLTIERILISREHSFHLDVGENEIVFLSTEDSSALQFLQDGASAPITTGPSTLHDKGPGGYTISRPSDKPVEVYLVRMSNA